jgi:hypothetical protein
MTRDSDMSTAPAAARPVTLMRTWQLEYQSPAGHYMVRVARAEAFPKLRVRPEVTLHSTRPCYAQADAQAEGPGAAARDS